MRELPLFLFPIAQCFNYYISLPPFHNNGTMNENGEYQIHLIDALPWPSFKCQTCGSMLLAT